MLHRCYLAVLSLSFSTHSRILFSSEYFHYKIFIHEKCLENQNDKFQENLSQHGIIDARARYRPTAQRLRNTALHVPYFMRQLSFVTSCCCPPCMWVMSCLDYVNIIHEPTGSGNEQSSVEIVILYKTKIKHNIFISAHSWCDNAEIR